MPLDNKMPEPIWENGYAKCPEGWKYGTGATGYYTISSDGKVSADTFSGCIRDLPTMRSELARLHDSDSGEPQSNRVSSKKESKVGTFFAHLALGAGSYAGLAAIPRDRPSYAVALSGTALVAAFKEGSDAVAGRDTKKQAIFHALSILAGAGIVAAAWH